MRRHLTVLVAALALVAGAVAADYVAKVHSEGPDKLVVESGGELELKTGSTLDLSVGTITGTNSDSLGVGATNNALTFTVDGTNTGTFVFADAAGAANGAIDVSGAGALDFGSADVTDIQIITDGGTLDVGTTASTLLYSALSTGPAVFMGGDAAGAADTVFDTVGAGTVALGSADVTSAAIITDGTGDGELSVPENSIGPDEVAVMHDWVIACGELAENGTTYFGPANAIILGNGSTSYALGTAGCDALDNTTEGTADAPVTNLGPFKVDGIWCTTDAALGAGESATYTVRSAEGDLTPSVTCTIAESTSYCRSLTGSTTDIGAGATLAIKAVQSSNNADDNGWCKIYISLK